MSEWKRQEGEETIFRTCAWSPPGCHPVGCGLQVHVKDGVVTEVEGDPEHPLSLIHISEASRRPSVYCMRSLMEPFFVSTSTISFSASGQRPAFTSYWF